MVRTILDDGAAVAPFLTKCYDMVDDPITDSLISWSTDGYSFGISDKAQFESQLLPKYFKHNNFASFMRQLNIYGFRKIDSDKWIFANDGFIRGQNNLLKNIHRRKQSQVIVQPAQQKKKNVAISSHDEEKKLNGLWKELESLKADKNLLMQELANLRQHQENSHGKLAILREKIKDMEKDQQQMLSFIVMAMQNPGFFVHIFQPKESKGVFNRVIVDDLEENAPSSERMIVRYQPQVNQSSTQLHPNKFLGLDASSDEYKEFFGGIDCLSEPMDDDLFSFETRGPVISDQADDFAALERFLLSSPLREETENGNVDEAEAQNLEMESLELGFELEREEKLETLTERIGN